MYIGLVGTVTAQKTRVNIFYDQLRVMFYSNARFGWPWFKSDKILNKRASYIIHSFAYHIFYPPK